MHGVDWTAIATKYAPLVDRVTDRAELTDLLAQMVGELSALHIFVRGGDLRQRHGRRRARVAGGAARRATQSAGGYRVDAHLPVRSRRPGPSCRRSPARASTSRKATSSRRSTASPTLERARHRPLLRAQAGQQVLLQVKPRQRRRRATSSSRRSIATRDDDLRYDEWEYTRRLEVERGEPEQDRLRAPARDGQRRHRASGRASFYPVFNRDGLIIDVRHNRGGNIDSWLLGRLLRKAWFYWQPRVGQSDLEHAVRLPRPRRGAGRRVHRLRRRGVRRGLPAARAWAR